MRFSFVAVAVAAFPLIIHAQTAITLTPGTRVRVRGLEVTDRGDRIYNLEGAVAGADSNQLLVRVDGRSRPDSLPYFMMHRLEMHQGQTPRRRLVLGGLMTGGVAGLSLWTITMLVPRGETSRSTTIGPDGTPHITVEHDAGNRRFALISIPVLSLTGLTLGSLMSNDIWVRVGIPGLRDPNPR